MVYCGKPSKACSECRIKRRKCDFSKPSCRQCIRARSACVGYRDQVALEFRDQSTDVIAKAQRSPLHVGGSAGKKRKSSKKPSCDREISKVRSTELREALPQYCSPYNSLVTKDHPTAFFFHHYLLSEQSTGSGHIDCLSLIYDKASANISLPIIIEAIGMASLSNARMSPYLMDAANGKFSVALHRIRAGLENPTEARSDQMLVAVMLFTLYETVTCNVPEKTTSWDSHVDGALTLLNLRGVNQLKYKTGRKIFFQLRTEVLISAFQRVEPVSQGLVTWMTTALDYETEDEKQDSHLARIIVRICSFRASTKDIVSTEHPNMTNLAQLISEAVSINADLTEWKNNLPATYCYTLLSVEGETFPTDEYHEYSNLGAAYTWNLYRCASILLNQTLKILVPLPQAQLTTSAPMSSDILSLDTLEATIQDATKGICMNVPFILGRFEEDKNKTNSLRASCGIALLWPIYIVGIAQSTSNYLRKWAILQLENIGNSTGVRKAHVLAADLRKHS